MDAHCNALRTAYTRTQFATQGAADRSQSTADARTTTDGAFRIAHRRYSRRFLPIGPIQGMQMVLLGHLFAMFSGCHATILHGSSWY